MAHETSLPSEIDWKAYEDQGLLFTFWGQGLGVLGV